ncbi:zinc finger protein 91-like isoform X3 [Uranotaenia lowii]|nr:zinc finger protein 91-like isoform X2 [Uranotaenia lowii]XP_055587548.1 zinc finger protein 91-like isoform X3 [Uranotaenia lowii]
MAVASTALAKRIKTEPLDADMTGTENARNSIENVQEVASKVQFLNTVVDRVHLRHVMLYEFRKGSNATTALKNIRRVYGNQAPARRTVFLYFSKFRIGDFSLGDLSHVHHDEYADKPALQDHPQQPPPASSELETARGSELNHEKTSDQKMYECQVCLKKFHHLRSLDRHYVKAHVDDPQYECEYCHNRFLISTKLKSHLRICHANISIDIEEPDANLQQENAHTLSQANLASKTSDLSDLRDICVEDILNLGDPETSQYTTPEDNSCFLPDDNVMEHVESSVIEEESSRKNGRYHSEIDNAAPKIFQCEICHMSFTRQCSLNRHYVLQHVDKPELECQYCREHFPTPKKLKLHKTRCEVNCERIGEHNAALQEKEHCLELTDTIFEKNPVSCISEQNLLISGDDSTTEDAEIFKDKYRCDKCPASFNRKHALTDHFAAYHLNKQRYECEFCGKRFFFGPKYESHRINDHLKEYNALLRERKLQTLPKNCLFQMDGCKIIEESPTTTTFEFIDIQDGSIKTKKEESENDTQSDPKAEDKKRDDNSRKCKRCFKTIHGSLKRHIAIMHKTEQRFECKKCHKRFFRSAGFKVHQSYCGANVKERYNCDGCELTFKKEIFLWDHFTSKHLEKPRYECEFCGERFDYHQKYYCHRKNDHLEEYNALLKEKRVRSLPLNCLFKMDGCKIVEEGIFSVNGQPGSGLETNESQTAVSIGSENETNGPEMYAHECRLCHKTFNTVYKLDCHYTSLHENEPQYECEDCNKRFLSTEGYKTHRKHCRLNKFRNRYSCGRCSSTFGYMQHLKDHFAAKHLKKPRYECEFCGQRFFIIHKYISHRKTEHREEYEALLKRSNVRKLPYNCLYRMEDSKMWKFTVDTPSTEVPQTSSTITIDELAASFSFTPEPQTERMIFNDLIEIKQEETWKDALYDPEATDQKPEQNTRKFKRRFKTFEDSFQRNIAVVHKRRLPFKCGYCNRRFLRSAIFKVHQMRCEVNARKRYNCDRCKLLFKKELYLWDHYTSKHLEKPRYECEFCGERFFYNKTYYSHRKNGHLEEYNALLKQKNVRSLPFNCLFKMDGCKIVDESLLPESEQASSKLEINKSHTVTRSKNEINEPEKYAHECRLCRRTFNTIFNLDCHYASMHEDKPQYECEHCKKRFLSSERHKSHQRICRFNKLRIRYSCCRCPSTFSFVNNLKDHFAAKHLKKHRYECEFCGERFFFIQKYVYHRKSKHREEYQALLRQSNDSKLPFNYLFRMDDEEMWKLIRIKATPGTETPTDSSTQTDTRKRFNCRLCPKTFQSNENLDRHYVSTHKDEPQFQCEYCNELFLKSVKLNRHKRTCKFNESKDKYACELCPATFKLSHSARRHFAAVHLNKQ